MHKNVVQFPKERVRLESLTAAFRALDAIQIDDPHVPLSRAWLIDQVINDAYSALVRIKDELEECS
jgi:hypothetical protein